MLPQKGLKQLSVYKLAMTETKGETASKTLPKHPSWYSLIFSDDLMITCIHFIYKTASPKAKFVFLLLYFKTGMHGTGIMWKEVPHIVGLEVLAWHVCGVPDFVCTCRKERRPPKLYQQIRWTLSNAFTLCDFELAIGVVRERNALLQRS